MSTQKSVSLFCVCVYVCWHHDILEHASLLVMGAVNINIIRI